jgi:hypothetical protein
MMHNIHKRSHVNCDSNPQKNHGNFGVNKQDQVQIINIHKGGAHRPHKSPCQQKNAAEKTHAQKGKIKQSCDKHCGQKATPKRHHRHHPLRPVVQPIVPVQVQVNVQMPAQVQAAAAAVATAPAAQVQVPALAPVYIPTPVLVPGPVSMPVPAPLHVQVQGSRQQLAAADKTDQQGKQLVQAPNLRAIVDEQPSTLRNIASHRQQQVPGAVQQFVAADKIGQQGH